MSITASRALDIVSGFFEQRFRFQVQGPSTALSLFNGTSRPYHGFHAVFGVVAAIHNSDVVNYDAIFDGALLGALQTWLEQITVDGDDLLVWRRRPHAEIEVFTRESHANFDHVEQAPILRITFRAHTMKVVDAIRREERPEFPGADGVATQPFDFGMIGNNSSAPSTAERSPESAQFVDRDGFHVDEIGSRARGRDPHNEAETPALPVERDPNA